MVVCVHVLMIVKTVTMHDYDENCQLLFVSRDWCGTLYSRWTVQAGDNTRTSNVCITEMETYTDIQTHRHIQTDIDWHIQTDIDRHIQTDIDWHIQTDIDRHIQTDTPTHTDRHRLTHTDRHRLTHTDRHRLTHTDRHRLTHTDRHRLTETIFGLTVQHINNQIVPQKVAVKNCKNCSNFLEKLRFDENSAKMAIFIC